jgi:chemotaxis protein CheD
MKNQISIHIGEYHASSEPAVIHTVLGSCVAVCLLDPVNQIGGMNHILLPGRADMNHFDDAARYGINAMELLINRIMGLGGDRRQLIAKVFGGAHVVPAISKENGVGRKNAVFVLQFLKNERIRIINKDLGGHESRKVYFHTDTGDVFLKRIRCANFTNIALEEKRRYGQVQKDARKAGEVTLFQGDHQYTRSAL